MANHTENIGIGICKVIAEKNNWFFREQPVNDIGIDAHIEYIDSADKPKQLLALQIKTGNSYFNEKKDGSVIFRDIDDRQYVYWTMNSLPCIIVLYNPDTDLCIWQKLSKDTIQKTKGGIGKGYFVNVPINQVFLNSKSNGMLLSITNLPEHVVNYNFLSSQKYFMEIILNGGIVKLHSMEWVNKSSGRGTTELIVEKGDNIEKYQYPYWFPYTPYELVFPRLFPWATFSADDEFYADTDEAEWREYNCWYDNEEDELVVVGDSFEEYRKSLNPIRSIDHSGEVAEYMLVLGLNDLGKSFLIIDEYLSNKQPYVDARTSREKSEDEI